MFARKRISLYIRNIVFGVEDSLVSTVGLLAGLAAAGTGRDVILLTGAVLVFVEALSMAAGSFLSEESVEEYEHKKEAETRYALLAAVLMFVSYVVAGFFPILPYFFLDGMRGLYASVALSLVLLAVLGAWHGRVAQVSKGKSILRMLVIGGATILLGIAVGQIFGVA